MANKQILNELALFAGAGGGILGGYLLGWKTICAVEIDAYCAGILVQRQNDGILPPFPIWDDVRTFSGNPWRGIVDVVSGGFPCQDISAAGKGAGIDGERSGLWREMARIIGEVRPRFAFVENSSMLTSRGLRCVLGDLAEMGYNARWGIVSAAYAGCVHNRERCWILAYTNKSRCKTIQISAQKLCKKSFNSESSRIRESFLSDENFSINIRNDDEMAKWMDRFEAVGNGQVPAVAQLAWEILSDGLI